MKLIQLHEILEKKFPRVYACEWDNDGLMCAAKMDAPVNKVLCTLDVTTEALLHAYTNGFDTIISHHPLIFRPLGAITPDYSHVARKALYALQNGINVFSYHTRFDAMPGGINDLLANQLELLKIRTFGDGESDMGRLGELHTEMSAENFCKFVKEKLGCDTLSYSKSEKNTVKTVAVLGGAGKDFIDGARKAGADVLVSGELGYNNMAEALERGIMLVEAGHFFTEDVACKYFSEIMDELGIDNEYFCSNRIKTI